MLRNGFRAAQILYCPFLASPLVATLLWPHKSPQTLLLLPADTPSPGQSQTPGLVNKKALGDLGPPSSSLVILLPFTALANLNLDLLGSQAEREPSAPEA